MAPHLTNAPAGYISRVGSDNPRMHAVALIPVSGSDRNPSVGMYMQYADGKLSEGEGEVAPLEVARRRRFAVGGSIVCKCDAQLLPVFRPKYNSRNFLLTQKLNLFDLLTSRV